MGYIRKLESKADQEIAYTLPDGTAVTSTHLDKVLDSMFCPSLMGSELDGVHQRAYDYHREQLKFNNIKHLGGS